MRLRQASGDFLRECCQMRMTFHSLPRSWRVTRLSRAMFSPRDQQPCQFQHDLHLGGLVELSFRKQSARAIERFSAPMLDLFNGQPDRQDRCSFGGSGRELQDVFGIPHQPAPEDMAAVSQNSRKSMRLHSSMPNIFIFTSVVFPPR